MKINQLLTPKQAREKCNCSWITLHRWVSAGRLSEYRTPNGHRRYDPAEIDKIFKKRN